MTIIIKISFIISIVGSLSSRYNLFSQLLPHLVVVISSPIILCPPVPIGVPAAVVVLGVVVLPAVSPDGPPGPLTSN